MNWKNFKIAFIIMLLAFCVGMKAENNKDSLKIATFLEAYGFYPTPDTCHPNNCYYGGWGNTDAENIFIAIKHKFGKNIYTDSCNIPSCYVFGNNDWHNVYNAIMGINTNSAASLTLTTTGTSGASTYTGGVLNIPIYSNGSSGAFIPLAGTTYTAPVTGIVRVTPSTDGAAFMVDTTVNGTSIGWANGSSIPTATTTANIYFGAPFGSTAPQLYQNVYSVGTFSNYIRSNNTGIGIQSGNSSGSNGITLSSTNANIVVNSSKSGFQGLIYQSDYSANYVSLSLISQGYALSTFLPKISPAYTGTLTAGTLPYSATNAFATFQSNVNNYNQIVISNTSSLTAASTDFIVSNNKGTNTSYYGDFGMNSSTYTGSGSFNLPNAVYLYSDSGDCVLGSTTNNTLHLVVNNSTVDAITISPTASYTNGVISNMNIAPRSFTIATTTTLTLNKANYDVYTVTSLSTALTVTNSTVTPLDKQLMEVVVMDNGTSQTLTLTQTGTYPFLFGASAPAPAATTVNKRLYMLFQFNGSISPFTWDCIATNQF